MKKIAFILIGSMAMLTSCQTSDVLDTTQTPQPASSAAPTPSQGQVDPSVSNLVAKECAVYFAIEDQLEAEGRPANGKIYEGCHPSTSVSADITARDSAPASNGSKAKIFYRKMIARGAPKDIADQVSKSRAFAEWVNAAN